ncbi:cysteine desulfurase IscS [Paraliobacillus ryukyuensis]|uniref:cysteine desulfurase n=1 Tax=Paraliobacillus ryukyuensis TaxID=200904 RepID=A0A366EIQ9_9BACI|nr:cysteine desulfurase family protein [Paraliobacillus ryukyuensis]RBP01305.1 cysteine desulfurase [Paraliobacillus ryukyuensis]
MEPIYLDHAATAPVHPDVIETMHVAMKDTFGNPSSVHHFGRKARKQLDEARRVAAVSIGANEKEITFTSGGTEADNLALIGVAYANKQKGNHIITTEIEHHAILHTAEYLEKQGFHVTYLPVNEQGQVSVADVEQALTDQTILVSIMMVNNETGMIQPIEEIGELLLTHQAYFHTDAVQAYGLLSLDVSKLGVDLLTTSAHKINGPKGIGFLYIKNGTRLEAIHYGGEQERKRRPGTENYPAILGFKKAIELVESEREKRSEAYISYKQLFVDTLKEHAIDFSINGSTNTVPAIVNISFPGTNVEALLMNFDLEGIAASSGSACTAGSVEPSHVLMAMYGEGNEKTTNSIRFSFGLANDQAQVKTAAETVAKIVARLNNK